MRCGLVCRGFLLIIHQRRRRPATQLRRGCLSVSHHEAGQATGRDGADALTAATTAARDVDECATAAHGNGALRILRGWASRPLLPINDGT